MLAVMMGFTRCLMSVPKPWRAWLMLLLSVNVVFPFFFLGTPEAKVVLVGMGANMVFMMTLFARFGFVRLLGLGHAPWLFTVPWLWLRLGEVTMSGPFYYWLIAVAILNSISLVIDGVDVVRYWMGERQSTMTPNV